MPRLKDGNGTDIRIVGNELFIDTDTTEVANQLLTTLLTVDGASSGLDADLLDGQEGTHYLARANHTGTQPSSTISDFSESVDDRVAALLSEGANISIVYDDSGNSLEISADVTQVKEPVKNVSGATLAKGTPVHQTSSGTGSFIVGVEAADASNAALMPAVGILAEELAPEAEGEMITMGLINGVNTSAFASGDVIYVSAGGGYTNVRPSGESTLVQNLGIVTRVDASNGGGVILGSGRSNDVPNLNNGNIFIGDANNDPSVVTLSTTIVPEGSNLYYTDARVNTDIDARVTKAFVDSLNVDADTLDGLDGSQYVTQAEVAAVNGVASLDGNGKVPTTQMPSLALSEIFVVVDNTERDALTVQEGDVAKVTSTNLTYVYDGSQWIEIVTAYAVDSVNGQTGVVVITAADVSYDNSGSNLVAVDVKGALDELDSGKAALVHTHVESDITDLDKYTQAQVDAKDDAVEAAAVAFAIALG